MPKILQPLNGFVFISPQTSTSSFTIPEDKGVIRTGEVVAIGGSIYHTSGKELPCPVKVGDVVTYQYYEDEGEGKPYYHVSFNRLTGVAK